MNDLTALEKQTIERAVAGDQKALEEAIKGGRFICTGLATKPASWRISTRW